MLAMSADIGAQKTKFSVKPARPQHAVNQDAPDRAIGSNGPRSLRTPRASRLAAEHTRFHKALAR